MSVSSPPRPPRPDDPVTHGEFDALVEALIEEARQRARRRRRRYGAAALLVTAVAVASFIGYGGRGGGGAGAAPPARADAVQPPVASAQSPPLAALPAGAGYPQVFAFDPRRPNIVYVASVHGRSGVHVYKTTDGGRHWHVTGATGTGWVTDILSLTADPRHPGTLYAGTDTAVYKTVDGGRSWHPFNHGLFPPKPHACYSRTIPRGVCRGYPFGTPATPNWNRGNGWVLDVAVDPIHSNVVYAAADGVRKSTDSGHTWKAVFVPRRLKDVSVSRIGIAPTRPESIYALAHNLHNGDTALYKSTDAGKTWRPLGSGSSLPASCCWDSEDALAVDAGTPRTLYAVVGNTVFATTDSGASWQPMMNGLPASDVTSLAADPTQSGTLYASILVNNGRVSKPGAVEGAIFKTTDGGQTWSEVYSGFGVLKIAIDPKKPSTIYAAGWARWDKTHGDTFSLLRSTDSGQTWAIGG